MTATRTNPVLVTMGAGKAVHYGFTGHMGQYATLCDGWGGYGNRRTTVRLTTAETATCKRCLKIKVQETPKVKLECWEKDLLLA